MKNVTYLPAIYRILRMPVQDLTDAEFKQLQEFLDKNSC